MKNILFLIISCFSFNALTVNAEAIKFNRDVRPILSEKCFFCHGPDPKHREAKLRLDTFEGATKEYKGRVAIAPGDLQKSEFYQRIIAQDEDDIMPPPKSHKELKKDEIKILKKWIEQGAEYEVHWAFSKVKRPSLPEKSSDWTEHPIDRFIAQGLARKKLKNSQQAKEHELLRRISFDLNGLPPSEEMIEKVGKQKMTTNNIVDYYLESHHYGERMAMIWLDLVRYADSHGYHSDDARKSSLYRDYVISSFNDNLPFDQFTIEQLAGDYLKNPTQKQKIATGYNRLNLVTGEFGANKHEYLAKYMTDRVTNVSSVWMGLTMGCAECHDHKYDPLSMKDFYSLGAFFADINEPGLYSGHARRSGIYPPVIVKQTDQQKKVVADLEKQVSEMNEKIKVRTKEIKNDVGLKGKVKIIKAAKKNEKSGDKILDKLNHELKKLNSRLNREKHIGVIGMITEHVKPREIKILPRGNWMDKSGDVVDPAIPAIFGQINKNGKRANRMDLAKWLVNKDNPLTARVFMNRLWAHLFGSGLSKNLADFGSQGDWPENSELLDYLADEFMKRNWDVKYMVRFIMNSNAYQQSSAYRHASVEADYHNRWFSRQNRTRLPAEVVRDNVLYVSGLLNTKVGGESVKPYQPNGYYDHSYGHPKRWSQEKDNNLYRRGMYTFWKRTNPHPGMLSFDKPTREECTAERSVSNTPLQALILLNAPVFVESARIFAQKIAKKEGDDQTKIEWAWKKTLSRNASDKEVAELKNVLELARMRFTGKPEDAKQLVSTGESPLVESQNYTELAAWTMVSRVLFNLHESITRP